MSNPNGAYRNIGGKLYLLQPRDYVLAITHDAVGSSTNANNFTVDVGSDFLLVDRCMEDSNDIGLAAPGIGGEYPNLVTVQDQTMNYSWSQGPVPRTAFARDRAHGLRLSQECIIAANTKIQITIQNRHGN